MNRTKPLRDLGQSLWLDNITREILDDGTADAAVDVGAIATHLQRRGAEAFVKSWISVLARIAAKSATLRRR